MAIRNLKDNSKKPWLCECYPNGRGGKRVRKRFATKGEATAYELFLMKEVDDKPWLGDKPDHRRLNTLIDVWFDLHGRNLKAGEKARYRMKLMSDSMNNPIAAHLTEKDILLYQANRTNKGLGRSNREISRSTNVGDVAHLKAMFNKLIKLKEWRFPNPLEGLETKRPQETELSFLTTEQIKHLFESIKQSDCAGDLRKIFKICLATGARINEAVLLKGSHVFDCKITYVNTKSKRNRTIPISKELYEELAPTSHGRLFSCSYGVAYKWLTLALPDLPYGQGTHVLRHTFATTFMRKGGNILDLKNALGHSNIKHTMIYAHFSPHHLKTVTKLNPIADLDI